METISSGCFSIDTILRGGFRTGQITEICGDEATGKTQLCLQILLAAQLPPSMWGLSASSIYIQSTGNFPASRLSGLVPHVLNVISPQGEHPMQKILVKQVESPYDLPETLQWLDIVLNSSAGMIGGHRVVIIDSVSSICRFHFSNTREGMAERSDLLKAVSFGLRSLAEKYNVAVVAVNDVVEVFPNDYKADENVILSNGKKVRPALGRSWSTNICTRLFLTKNFNETRERWDRTLAVILSPELDLDGCSFKITGAGIVDV